jgi:multicomponent Na+:H+ antiporter subunit B
MTSLLMVSVVLLVLTVVTAVAAVEARKLLHSALLMALFSLLTALVWAALNAVDAALAQAAAGAGILTLLLVGAIALVGGDEKARKAVHWPALIAVAVIGAALVYGTLDAPPAAEHDAASTVLDTYRALDSMVMVAVLLAAAYAMILLLRGRRGNPLKGGLL